MAKLHFLDYIPNEILLFPQRLDKDIAENDPVRILSSVVDNPKLENFRKLYNYRGRSPYHPGMMLKVILYGYMNNIYSCRKTESALKRDIHFIWLAGYNQPDFNTINRFRNRVKEEINNVFTGLVIMLAEKGFVSLDTEYIDGTKIEPKANKYTFVWKKSTERNRAKLLEKIKVLLGQIDEAIAQDNTIDEGTLSFTSGGLRGIADKINLSLESKPKAVTKEEKEKRKEESRKARQLREHADKLDEYDKKLETLGKRSSYSRTDPDATFMRMKEDAMMNGQTKPGYNLQTGTENQFILDFGLFQTPGDPLTMISFYESFYSRYGKYPQTGVADSGYGSEENYRFMDERGIEAYVKYNRFHMEQRMHYTPDTFSQEAFCYNKDEDYYVCPMGQHMTRVGTRHTKTESGYVTEKAVYRAQRCEGCPLRCRCFKAKGDRKIEVNYRLAEYRRKAAERLTSEEGIKHRGRRCIEPEAVFGQMKSDMAYKRFRHFGLDKVTMDFAFFAIAFNIKKMCAKIAKKSKNGDNTPTSGEFSCLLMVLWLQKKTCEGNCQKVAA